MAGTYIAGAALALVLTGTSAMGLGLVDTIIEGLKTQGYGRIETSTTLLGRTRIEASNSQYNREIVVNPATGEILRDYWEAIGDASGQTSGGLTDPSGSGTGSADDDDDDDDDNDDDNDGDDDDDDDDGGNSGSGGGSGSGGSGSGGSGGGGSGSGGSGGGGSDDDGD